MRLKPILTLMVILSMPLGLPAKDLKSKPISRVILSGPDVKESFEPVRGAVVDPGASRGPRLYSRALLAEQEPNDVSGSATSFGGRDVDAIGNIYPLNDVDFWSFSANAGDKIYLATVTGFSPIGNSKDTVLELIAPDGSTIIESDDDNGAVHLLSSTISGAVAPATGTYYVRVWGFISNVRPLTPYLLYLRLQSGTPTAETEPNDTTATANPLPASGWVSGTFSSTTDGDLYSMDLAAGDTVYLSLDLVPGRDNIISGGRLGFGEVGGEFLVVDDTGSSDTIPSEAFAITVPAAGTYYAYVDAPFAPTGDYELSVSVHAPAGGTCTTYTSTDPAQAIADDGTAATSTITIPGNPRIGDISVRVEADHQQMDDLDVHLVSPAGNDNGLFSDIGCGPDSGRPCTNPGFRNLDVVFQDETPLPSYFTPFLDGIVAHPGTHRQPRNPNDPVWEGGDFRLAWYDGEDAGGVWTLRLVDDTNNGLTGNITSWSVTVCDPVPVNSCGANTTGRVLYSEDFEAGDGGYTHSGTADEWEWGTPTLAPIDDCHSGTNCWKTDLDGGYDLTSVQDLVSTPFDLTNVQGPLTLEWAQKFSLEGCAFDHAYVEIREVGGANPRKLWEFMDGTMHIDQGVTRIEESSGWSVVTVDATAYACTGFELHFHLDSDDLQNYSGFAIDDVTLTGCADSGDDYIVGEGLARSPGGVTNRVRVFSGAGAASTVDFQAYGSANYGTNVSNGGLDAEPDGYHEILSGPGPGPIYGPHVRAWRAIGTGVPVAKVNFFAYGTLRYGVNVGSAEFELDGFDEILTGAGPGEVFGPHVRGWNYDGGSLSPVNKVNFYAYSTLRWGVNVEAGSIDGDCYDEIVTGAGPSSVFGSHVRGWNYDDGPFSTISKVNFFVDATVYGVNVTVGDIDGDDFNEIMTAPGPQLVNPPTFSGFNFDGTTVSALPGFPITPTQYAGLGYGGEVSTGDVNDDLKDDFITGAGEDPNALGTEVLAFDYAAGTLNPIGTITPFLGPYGTNVAAGALGF